MKQVLVVDDDKAIVDIIVAGLKPYKVNVHGVTTARDAINFMSSHEVDLLVVDIMIPGLKGTDLFSQLKKHHPLLQGIVISGGPTKEHITMALQSGVVDFLKKPFEVRVLCQLIHDTMQRIERWKNMLDILDGKTIIG